MMSWRGYEYMWGRSGVIEWLFVYDDDDEGALYLIAHLTYVTIFL